MLNQSLIAEDLFWKVLCHYESLEAPLSFEQFLEACECSSDKFWEISHFLLGLGFEVKLKNNQIIPTEKREVHLNFSEWLALQANLPYLKSLQEYPFAVVLDHKIRQELMIQNDGNLARVLDDEQSKKFVFEGQHTGYLKTLEECAYNHGLVSVKLLDNKTFDLYPHKLVYLDGDLCVVGEDCLDRCLVYFSTSEIKKIKTGLKSHYQPNFSHVEVNDFIFAIRAVSGNEERLVLKIKDQYGIDLNPQYHFLGNPFITSNMEGDMIWAASVEVSHELFAWLYEMKDSIEILDPIEIKQSFEAYCSEIKHKKSA